MGETAYINGPRYNSSEVSIFNDYGKLISLNYNTT
jgi:hypothetical protein